MLSKDRVEQLVRQGNPVPDEADLPEPRRTAIELLNASRNGELVMTDTRTRNATRDDTVRRSNYLRPFAIAASAALALILVVGGTTILIGGGESPPAEVAATTPTATPTSEPVEPSTPVTTSTAVVGAAMLPWTFEEVPAPMGWHWDVAVGSVGVVTASGDQEAVDIDFDGDGEPDEIQYPAIWYSPDLAEWTLVRLPTDPDTGCAAAGWKHWEGDSHSSNVKAGPLGYIAIGFDECNATAWISGDGVTWERIVHPEWQTNPQALRAVAPGGPGWVAVGSDLRGNGVVWASSDGRDWQRIEDDNLLGTGRPVDIWDIEAGGPGLVAVGIEGTESSEGRSVVWVSHDGFEWERLPDDTVGGAGLFYLSVDPATARMVTFSRPPTDIPLRITPGQAWVSTDGRTWVGSSIPAAPITGHAVWHEDLVLAASRGQNGGDPELWLSEDEGLTWHLIEGPEGSLNLSADYAPFAIEHFADRILIVGQCDDCSGVWISQPSS